MKKNLIRLTGALIIMLLSGMVASRLPYYQALDFLAIQLSMIGGLFIAFAINDRRIFRVLSETGIAVVTLICTLSGMWKWPWLIPSGFMIVALWAIMHRHPNVGASMQTWLADLIAIYCLFITSFIYVWISIL